VAVRFTEKGRKVVQRAVVAIEDADDSFFAALERRELAVYKSLARRLIAGNDRQ
jgi:DNA-binding MarR family transcriptional regulator